MLISPEAMVADIALARQLERAEGLANAEFVASRALAFPESGAEWIELARAWAMFDGVDAPALKHSDLGFLTM